MAAVCLGDVDLLPDAEMGGVPFSENFRAGVPSYPGETRASVMMVFNMMGSFPQAGPA